MPITASRALPVFNPVPPPRGDLTRVPVLGRFFRWKHARTAVQIPLLLLAAVIVLDGFLGPRVGPENAAGVIPWVQWRGFVVLGLLVAGNLFCMACPFMLPRRLARKLLPGDRSWPSWLRGKWLALGLLVLFFWAYEAFDLWNSPWLTAWVIVAYFAGAFVVDGFFKGAAFCKHVCPIGSFNFVNSFASPAEVRIRDASMCDRCETKDCIRGRYEPVVGAPAAAVSTESAAAAPGATLPTDRGRLTQSGCELWLFQPRKVGNMDCTFCLDCVQACPHENVGIIARVPGAELVSDRLRSGIGRLAQRPDLLALVVVVVFGGFVNAAGMTAPLVAVQGQVAALLGITSEMLAWTLFLALGLFVAPALLLGATTLLSRALAGPSVSARAGLLRFGYGLVPVGFGMWLAHYGFHVFASGLTIVPVLHRVAGDVGLAAGAPNWSLGPLLPDGLLIPVELLFLEAGLLGSILVFHYIARSLYPDRGTARRAFVPWALLAVGLAAVGAWIMTQPMAMRGMMMPGMEM